MKILTTKDIVAKFIQLNGKNKFDYSCVNYKNAKEKVEIICKKCNNHFWQLPYNHLKGKGCPYCVGRLQTNNDFIQKAKLIHGDIFDYSKVNYINENTKVEIICEKCKNHFWQLPYSHKSGLGCPYCSKRKKYNNEEIIQLFQNIHGNKYDYSKVDYNGNKKNIIIICNKCGKEFKQKPTNHLSGCGCPNCYGIHKKTKEQFIEEAQKIHGIRFDYSKVDYKGIYKKIFIKCNKCGKEFKQSPHGHLRGRGCPYCKQSKGELKIQDFLELNKIYYISQKRFKDCKDKRPLPFDFYLPDYNICIEYQGKQHYDNNFFRLFLVQKDKINEKFQNLLKHDKIKKEYCKKNHIKLLEIKYNDNIEKILKEVIMINIDRYNKVLKK